MRGRLRLLCALALALRIYYALLGYGGAVAGLPRLHMHHCGVQVGSDWALGWAAYSSMVVHLAATHFTPIFAYTCQYIQNTYLAGIHLYLSSFQSVYRVVQNLVI